MKFGVDFGGVIVKPADGDNPFDAEMDLDIEQPNAISSICAILDKPETRLWIISKASKATQIETRKWFARVEFYQKTGFDPSNLIFCGKRSEKRGICEELEITHFVDDSYEVLSNMIDVVPNLYLFGGFSNEKGINVIKDWTDLFNKISRV